MVTLSYASKLNDVFDRLYVHGVAQIFRADLLLWHNNQQKVTKKLLRNIQEAWVKRCCEEWEYDPDEVPPLLYVYQDNTATFTFVWGGDFDETGNLIPWLENLSEAGII